jgi:hypothetical protein
MVIARSDSKRAMAKNLIDLGCCFILRHTAATRICSNSSTAYSTLHQIRTVLPRPQRNRPIQALGSVMTFVEQPLDHNVTEDMIKNFLKTVSWHAQARSVKRNKTQANSAAFPGP